ncbi:tape measure protein [uncultured Selenomonas sp.]|uniref:tape measure protein n=1 Tax=uncultured Selenomonas sp. TaxID=159275 RepID=UPI0028D8E085|nr:tape measure protein [uncultured Selenomonas sp.]
MANKEISIAIRARDYATAAFERVRQTVASIKDQTINVRANTGTAQAAVQSVRDKLAGIRDKVVSVKVDTGGAEANIAGANNALAEFATKAGLAAIAVTALNSALSAGKSAFIDYNAQLEQTRVAFTSMLGSAQLADTIIADLQKFAAETPFEMPGVRDAAQQLLAFGYDAQEIIPTLTALGNAASGLGRGQDGFNHLAFVFGQIRTTGQLMGQDVMQLAQLGVPVKDILAKNLGLTKEELARIGELGIDANVAIKALIDGMNERFPEMMKKQSETFEGVLSNIKDNIGQAFGLSGLPLFEDAKNMLLEIKNITDTMLANVQGGKSLFAGILPDDLLEKMSTFWETIKKGFNGVQPVAETLLWEFSKLANVLLDVGSIALMALRPITPIARVIGRAVFGVIGAIASVLDTVLDVVLTVETHVADAFDSIYSVIADVWSAATDVVREFCTAVIDFIAGIVAEVDETVTPVIDIFKNAFQAAADWVYESMETAIGYVRRFIAWVEEAIAAVKELAIVKAASDLIGSASDSVDDVRARGRVWRAVRFGESAAKIGDGLDGDIIVPRRTEAAVQKGTGASTWGGGKKPKAHKSTDKAAREAERLAEKIKSLTEKVQQSIASLAHDIVNEVGTTYEKGMDALHQKMEQMQKEIKEAADLGIDTTALRAKLDEYANIVKEKVTKAWREANEDLRSETALTWAQVNKDVRAEAEATYQIGVTKLNREKENRLKEVAMTKDSAEARVAVEQWAAAEMAKLDQQRIEALRKSPQTTQEALRATLEEQYEHLRDAGAQMKEMTDSLFTSMADGFTSGFQNVLTDGFKGIQDAFSNMLKNMLNAIVKFVMNQMITRWLSMILPGFGGGGGIPSAQANAAVPSYRATGGPVASGRTYLVGERGPEIFRPTQPGRIFNSLSSGGGAAPNIRVIVNNNTNERMTGTAETKFNGSEWVTSIMIDAIATNRNGMRDVIKGAV